VLSLTTMPVLAWADFDAFEQVIPHTQQSIAMVPIKGGSFTMGSAGDEPGHQTWEGPQRTVTVDDFWMGQYEINWQQYEIFVYRDEDTFTRFADQEKLDALAIDGVTAATSPYVEMSFGMGKEGFPAVNITQHAALQYARWLSAKTGRFYRLPTEAEWEYACRAGSNTPWSFGDDPTAANDYAIYADNSEERYATTGSRKPNPWQLYDMHGNVAEWTMDQFNPDYYQQASANNPWNRPTELYPRVARGGSWVDTLDQLRCAARRPSAANWKERDPQIPKSLWWLTNAPFVGFRLVSPRTQPSPQEIAEYWLEAIEDYGI
jgi:formylglycine-generating enzyme required for sulfatase activity